MTSTNYCSFAQNEHCIPDLSLPSWLALGCLKLPFNISAFRSFQMLLKKYSLDSKGSLQSGMTIFLLRMNTGSSCNNLQPLVALSSKISLDENLLEDGSLSFFGLFQWLHKAQISLGRLLFHPLSSKIASGVHLLSFS